QLAYAIGVAQPVGLYVHTFGRSNVNLSDSEIAEKVNLLFDLRPGMIEERLKLRFPIYAETASYGHMGRTPVRVVKHFCPPYHKEKEMEVELFTWENLDYVDAIREAFAMH
ncbi:MAG TPA: methionine adenosyltransferase domain-containing protein, partial [Prolixibacteraceae bacterium]|nr:methionine adenosyltransferase domain-containing protein [Prolixibacteraceae bacterium]